MTLSRITARAAAVLAAGVIAVALSSCSLLPGGASSSPKNGSGTASGAMPTGTKGAVDFDAGYVTVGTGKITVDAFVDPMCPYCGEFEKANGSQLASLVNDSTITLRIHPLTFLDKSSQGSKYSSRASASLVCVAAAAPHTSLVYLSSLFTHQPAEGSSGLTDAELVQLAKDAGASDASSCITNGDNIAWAQKFTRAALSGGIKHADISSIRGTPTILVNGHEFGGDFTSADAVKAFITGGGATA